MIVVKLRDGDKTTPLGNFTLDQMKVTGLFVGNCVEIKGLTYKIEKINDQIPSMTIIDVRKV